MSYIADAALTFNSVKPSAGRVRRQMMLGQVKCESNFGYAFKTPDGSPSHNWGAIYAKGDRGTFEGTDTEDGKVWHPQVAWNSSAAVGARQYVNLIEFSYPKAYAAAATGNAWDFANGLWRLGPNSAQPPYYGGFPPGHKWSLAPNGTVKNSPADYYYRKLAYAKMVAGCAADVARALGEPVSVFVKAPAPPRAGSVKSGSKSIGGLGLVAILAGGGYLLTRNLRA